MADSVLAVAVALACVLLVVGAAALIGTTLRRQQSRIRGGVSDLRRADEQEPPFDDYFRPLG